MLIRLTTELKRDIRSSNCDKAKTKEYAAWGLIFHLNSYAPSIYADAIQTDTADSLLCLHK